MSRLSRSTSRDSSVPRAVRSGSRGAILLALTVDCTSAVLLGKAQADPPFVPPFNSYATGDGPTSVTIADLNRDGLPDLVVSNQYSVSVVLGNGDGTFRQREDFPASRGQDFRFSYGVRSTAVGDLNHDGMPDVVATLNGDSERGDVLVLFGNADGSLSTPQPLFPERANTASSVAAYIGDFNGDGLADVAVLFNSSPTSGLGVFLANPSGFTPRGGPGGNTCRAMASGDLNGDGRVDFVVPDDYDGTYGAGLGNADGSFEGRYDPREWIAAGPVAIGDVNGDGKQDVVTGLGLLLGNGDGTVGERMDISFGGKYPNPLALVDVDADGRLDLLGPDPSSDAVMIVLGNGAGTFAPAAEIPTGAGRPATALAGMAVGDLNGDGRPDVVATNYSANTVTVLLNGVHVPVAVEDLQAVRSEGRVRLSWKLSEDARRGVLGVRVRRADAASGPFGILGNAPLEPAPTMSFEDLTVVAGREYWYQVVLMSRDSAQEIAGSVHIQLSLGTVGRSNLLQPGDVSSGPIQIQYTIAPARSPARLAIFDVLGREVRILDQGLREPGDYVWTWDRRDTSGLVSPRGVYLVQLNAGTVSAMRKLVLLHR